MDRKVSQVALSRLMVFACFCTWASYLIAYKHGYSLSAKYSSPLPGYANHLWIGLQGLLLTLPGLAVGCVLARRSLSRGVNVGRSLMLTFVGIQLLDLLAFTYYHDRLFSRTSAKILFELGPTLVPTLNTEIVLKAIAYCVGVVALVATAWVLSNFISVRVLRSRYCPGPPQTLVFAGFMMVLCAVQPCLHWSDTTAWMRRSSDRHPVFSLGIFSDVNATPKLPVGREILTSSLVALSLAPELSERESQYNESSIEAIPPTRPDILLVVVETLRHEVISAETSPNLFNLANRGIWATSHFSSGNSTNVAMFSILYGLESIWYERRRNDPPALIRTAKECGYETAFFGGANDWTTFNMDGFISPKNFDEFEISDVDWTQSDAHMCEAAQHFLAGDDSSSQSPESTAEESGNRKPKLAVLYLYSSHFDYHSDDVDQIQTPSIEGRLTLGYSVSERDQVWNRYLNSVHCIDRLLGPLLDPNRLICVVGDHGESFLEDNSRMHGTKISKYQNMTPCMIAGPGVQKQRLECLTSHTDIVPTIFDAMGVEMKRDPCWDGDSMRQMPLNKERTIVTRDYLKPEIAIIHESEYKQSAVFGHRCFFSLETWTCFPGRAIDECGVIMDGDADSGECPQEQTQEALAKWLSRRFPGSVASLKSSEIVQLSKQLQNADPRIVAKATEISAYLSRAEETEMERLLDHDGPTKKNEGPTYTASADRVMR